MKHYQPSMLHRLRALYKAGVTENGPFAQYALEQERLKKGWWPFGYALLEELNANYTSQDELLLSRLYASLQAGRGVFKITSSGRLHRLDAMIVQMLPRFKDSTVSVHDAAVSNAITSVELFRKIADVRNCCFVASDFYDHLWNWKKGPWCVTFDRDLEPLQASRSGFVLPVARREPLRYIVNRLVQSYALQVVLPAAIRDVHSQRDGEAGESTTARIKRVSLFHPLAIECMAQHPAFELRQHDLFSPLSEPVQIFRIMNFLTFNHLPPERVLEGFRSCIAGVQAQGILIVGRTRDESDQAICATAYEVGTAGRFRSIWHCDHPWECEAFIDKNSVETAEGYRQFA